MSQDERKTREAIDKVAQDFRRQAERSGVPMTHDQARDRVIDARRKGDIDRDNKNR